MRSGLGEEVERVKKFTMKTTTDTRWSRSHIHSLSVTKNVPCRVGSVGSVSASHTVGCEFASRPGHIKDHEWKWYKLPPCIGMHASGLEFGSAARLSKRPGSVWNCLWGNALKRSPGIIRKSKVSYPGPKFLSSATWLSLPEKHYNELN